MLVRGQSLPFPGPRRRHHHDEPVTFVCSSTVQMVHAFVIPEAERRLFLAQNFGTAEEIPLSV